MNFKSFIFLSILVSIFNYKETIAQDVNKLEDVEISASKVNQKLKHSGRVTTVIDQEVISRSHGKSLSDLLNEQAGIVVAGFSNSPSSNKSLFFRGAGSAYALILIDGVPQNDPSGVGNTIDLRLLAMDQIEKIEIIKGAKSTIYGSDAVAGIINIITKKGGPKGNTVFGVLSAGSNQSFKQSVGLNGSVSSFDYNINYTHDKTDGINEAVLPIGVEGDRDGFKADQLNANFGLKLNEKWSVNPFVRYSKGTYNFDGGPFIDNDNYSVLKNLSSGVRSSYLLSSGKINVNYAYQSNINDAYTTYPSYTEGKMHLIDLFYTHKLTPYLDLLVGFDQRNLKLEATDNFPNTNVFAGYGSLYLQNLGRFNLEVGGRFNKHSTYGENYTYTINPSVNLNENLKLFGSVSTAFKMPSLSMLFGLFGANLNLRPERSENYEAGVDIKSSNEAFKVRIAAFKRNLTDAIIYAYPQGYMNQLSQNVKGFEIEPAFKFGKISINGFYGYLQGTEFNYIDNAVSPYLFRRPKHSFGITAAYKANERLFFSGNYKFFGKRTDGNFDTNQIEILSAFNVLNAYVEYGFYNQKFKLFFDAKNILNKKYTEFIGYNTLGFNFNTGVVFNIR